MVLAAQGSLAKLHGETIPGECLSFQNVWDGWPMAKFLGALVDKVFLGSTRKFSQGNAPVFKKVWEGGSMAKFTG